MENQNVFEDINSDNINVNINNFESNNNMLNNLNINSDEDSQSLSLRQVQAMFKNKQVESITVIFPCNVYPLCKTFEADYFQASVIDDSFALTDLVVAFNYDNVPIQCSNIKFSESFDLRAIIDKSSFRKLSWWKCNNTSLIHLLVFGKVYTNLKAKEEFSLYPRGLLVNLMEKYRKEHNVQFKAATELEYYILNEKTSKITEDFPKFDLNDYKIGKRRGDYKVMSVASKYEDLNKRLRYLLKEAGITVESIICEQGPGQLEINYKYGNILESCDNHIIIKECIRHITNEMNLGVSFLAKTFMNTFGSSSHVHISVLNAENSKSLFKPTENSESIYKFKGINGTVIEGDIKIMHFIGGILKYMREFFLIYGPNINSYKRYQVGSCSPTYTNTWGYDSRGDAVRIVGEGSSLHLEVRTAGSDVNPYLLLSTIIGCGMEGIENKIMPIDFEDGKNKELLESVPQNLYEAKKIFEKSETVKKIIGFEMQDFLSRSAAAEWKAFCSHISNFEIDRYLELS